MSLRMVCRMKEDETFTVSLCNPGNARLGPSISIEVTITSIVSARTQVTTSVEMFSREILSSIVGTVALRTPTGPSLPATGSPGSLSLSADEVHAGDPAVSSGICRGAAVG